MGLRERIAAGRPSAEEPGPVAVNGETVWLRRRLLEEIDLGELETLDPSARRARLEEATGRLLREEGPVLPGPERRAVIQQTVNEALGLGVLEPLLGDRSVTEIMVNGPDDVWIERDGRIERVPVRFPGEAELYQAIDRIVWTVNRRVDESNPMVDARLLSGERVNVTLPPLSLRGATITIRRFPRVFTLEELIGLGTLDRPLVELLGAMVRARLSFVISGGTGAGKTTLLNALSGLIPHTERIITVEDSAELQLQQPHVISLETRLPNVEAKGEVKIRDLVRNSLRMRPDRIIVGEVRGAETLDMLQAMNTGHEGSLATVHANSTEDAMLRLETLASMSEEDIPYDAIRDQINGAIRAIVQLERGADGKRRVVELAAVASRQRNQFRLATMGRFAAEPLGPDRQVRGRFEHFPLPALVARRLELAGERVPPEFGALAEVSERPEREAS